MHILVWSPRGVGESYGGPSMNAHRLINAMGDDLRFSLVHGNPAQEPAPRFEEQHFLYEMHHFSPLRQALFVHKGRTWIEANARRFDVVFGIEGFHPTVGPVHTAHRMGVPAVVFLAAYRTDLADKQGLPTRLGFPRRRRQMASELSGLIALSTAMAEELREYGIAERRIAVIPIGIDTTVFHPVADVAERSRLRAALGLRDMPTVVFVGGVNRRKQPHLLVEAAARLRRKGQDVQVVLVGPEQDAEYAAGMRAHAAEAGIEDLVVWYGFTREVAPLFRAADIYALISKNEGMPSALVEAMATGLPAIVTNISGAADVIEQGHNGVFVTDDVEAVSLAIAHYLDDDAARIAHGLASRARVEKQLSLTRVSAAYRQLFELAISGGDACDASLL